MKRMRKSIIWMAAFMFCCGAVFAQKAERKNVREGNKLYETEKFTEAEIAYRKSLEVNPRSSEGTYNLGNALYKQKKFPEAAEQYQLLAGQGEKMIETPEGKARLAEIYHNVGNIGMQSKEYAKSVEAYKQSLRLNPKDDETRYNLALAQKMLNGIKRLVFVIGGPYGFSEAVYRKADELLSLSKMTFSHQMVRMIFAEQIYRAMTIMKGEPYHHE